MQVWLIPKGESKSDAKEEVGDFDLSKCFPN